ncbi:neurotrimin isoform X3 [Stigmatopora nigra]
MNPLFSWDDFSCFKKQEKMSICGHFLIFFKCTALLSLKIIILVPTGLPVRSQGVFQSDKYFRDNTTVKQGETVFLKCAQEGIVTHTAWLNRSSILYAGEEKWSVDPRVNLVTLTQEEFTIKIENVDMTDEGPYVCAVQTNREPTTNIVHVIVQAPPEIINMTRDIVVNEGTNVTMLCQANGKPEPSITWKLISSSGGLATDDKYLQIPSITRNRAGTYECTAVNEIDTDVKTVDITVNYAPTVYDGRDIGVTLGQRGVLECEADAVPGADFEWYKGDRRFLNGFDGMEIVNTGSLSKLTFFNVSYGDYGNYTCVAINKLGSSNTSIVMYVQDGNCSTLGVQLDTCLVSIVSLFFLFQILRGMSSTAFF